MKQTVVGIFETSLRANETLHVLESAGLSESRSSLTVRGLRGGQEGLELSDHRCALADGGRHPLGGA